MRHFGRRTMHLAGVFGPRLPTPDSGLRTPDSRLHRRRSFTLAELLVVMGIILTMASALGAMMYRVMEHAKGERTQAQIAKLNQLLMERWDTYRSRSIRIEIPSGASPMVLAQLRLTGLRQIMRMELPDRKSDVLDSGVVPGSSPTILFRAPQQNAYRRQALASLRAKHPPPSAPQTYFDYWSETFQGAECLYLILASMEDGETSALDFFKPAEIGDVDDDGMLEVLDGWGRPIEFLRWAPGYTHMPGADGAWGVGGVDDDGNTIVDDLFERGTLGSDDEQASDIQRFDAASSPDPFDPLRVDNRWRDGNALTDPFALYPLIFSAGPDGIFDIAVDYDTNPATPQMDHFQYSNTAPPNDPYHLIPTTPPMMMGLPVDSSGAPGGGGNGVLECLDNITNHQLGAQL